MMNWAPSSVPTVAQPDKNSAIISKIAGTNLQRNGLIVQTPDLV
jgi:hypothetical protein